ncbi:TonB-dependent receptor plug [Flammeovirgaceae bacterium 311]|nr:TonB-dependent receptor plug [Flammeovirgaceae bacterium 311]
MRTYLKHIVLSLGISCMWLTAVVAQEAPMSVISANLKDARFQEFVQLVENQTAYRLYFDPVETDSLNITAVFNQTPLTDALEKVLSGSRLEYAINAKTKHIYITRDLKISTRLHPGFYPEQRQKEEITPREEFIVDYFEGRENTAGARKAKLYEIGRKTQTIVPGMARITGRVRNAKTGEQIVGATLLIEDPFIGTATDALGNYSLTIPKGRHTLKVRSVGMLNEELQIILYSDGKLDLDLQENVVQLKAVEIQAGQDANVTQAQMGLEKIKIETIRQVPTVMGEPDLLRVVLTLPGVKTVGEASTGFNVRGGAVDQNLILYSDATIYNPSHLFGFFSAFNSDVLEGVELYKSSIPAQYGGRLSSVLKITPRYGNKKKFEGKAGIGLLTSRVTIEAPIIKDKTSFILGGRTTYSNWLLRLLDNEDYKNSRGSFYDVNLNLTHELNENNNLYFTSYFSKDQFKLRTDTVYGYDTKMASLKWKKLFSDKLLGEFTGTMSQYKYQISSEANPVNAYDLSFNIDQLSGQAGFVYSLNAKHAFNFGLSSIHYSLRPGSFKPLGEQSLIAPDVLETEQALESALYLEDQFDISRKLSLHAGIRYSLFNYLGPRNVNTYAAGTPRSEESMLDTLSYGSGDLIQTYHGPEYRISARYLIAPGFSVKAGYNTLRQYIHMLSNTTAVSPTDIWKLSDPNIQPQFGEQFSLGLYKNFRGGVVETSVEGYYKNISNYLDYKGGAELIMNHAIEKDVVNTKGKAYGAEFMVKKLSGKLNGWFSYTYSRILLRLDDPIAGETINRGDWYPANYDKPHDLTLIGNYRFSHRVSLSLNCTYSTGRPITLPIARYRYGNSVRILYGDRNAHRVPDYFRTDLALNIEGNHKVRQLTHNSWTIGVYNLTGRENVYSTYFVSEKGAVNGYQLSIFGSAIPFVNYNIRF